MMPVTQLSVVRAMQDRRPNGGRNAEVRAYLRSECGEDGTAAATIAGAGRVTPAMPARPARGVSRALAELARALGSVFGQPGGS